MAMPPSIPGHSKFIHAWAIHPRAVHPHGQGLPDCGVQHLPLGLVRDNLGGGPRHLAQLLLLQPDHRNPRAGSHLVLRQWLDIRV